MIHTAGHKINELQVVNRVIMKCLLSLIFFHKMGDHSVSIEVHESFDVPNSVHKTLGPINNSQFVDVIQTTAVS